MPQVHQDPLDIVVHTVAERTRWLDTLQRIEQEQVSQTLGDAPVSGTLHITVVKASLSARLRHSVKDEGVFVVVHYQGIEWRTMTRDFAATADGGDDVCFRHD